MPNKRDDAAYKAAYDGGRYDVLVPTMDDRRLLAEIDHWSDIGRVTGPDRFFGRFDGLVDAACDRGLCASVRDWHKKPAGDELPW